MKVTVHVTRRSDIADPQGGAVAAALRDLGFAEVAAVRVNRRIDLEVHGTDPEVLEQRVTEMCERLLANPVMEDYQVVVTG